MFGVEGEGYIKNEEVELPSGLPEEEENTEETSNEDVESGINPNVENPINEDKNVFVGDVEGAEVAANDLELEPEEEKEDEGKDPYNSAEAA